jgi:RNA polymerase sigma-70 factor (ECF subfamily)
MEARPTEASDDALRRRIAAEVARYCPVWLRASADDIVQAAWLRLDEARRRDERNREIGASLLSKVAYCATVDEIRRDRRRREVPVDTLESPAPQRPADDLLRSREIGRGVRDCMTTMVPNRCMAATLFLLGHSSPEIGRILGWSLRKTENLVFRGMADLRRCLTSKGITP